MNYIYVKEGIAAVNAFDSFIDIVHCVFGSRISDCVRPAMGLHVMPGKAYDIHDSPMVIAHSTTPTGPLNEKTFLVHPIDFNAIIHSLLDCDFVLLAVIPPSTNLSEYEFVANLRYIARRKSDGVLIDIITHSEFPEHIAVLPVMGFYNVKNTSIYCAVVNENMARLPYNCDITTETLHIRTVGREDGSLKQAVVSPHIDGATQLSTNILICEDQPFHISFFCGPYFDVTPTDQIEWWKNMNPTFKTNLTTTITETGILITPPVNKLGYVHIKFNSGVFCDDSNDPAERFEYSTLIISS